MPESADLAAAIACRKWYEMELEQLKLAERSGELVSVRDVRRRLDGLAAEIAARCEGGQHE